jgi:hypothetical protein
MGTFLIQAVVAAYSNDGETIWVTMLVLAVIVAGAGVWSFVKKKPAGLDEQQDDYPYYSSPSQAGRNKQKWPLQQQEAIETSKNRFAVASVTKSSSDLEPATAKITLSRKRDAADRKQTDRRGGMELLGLDFLLSVVSDTEHNGSTDVTMHELIFKELIRRQKVSEIESKVLKEYALNKGSLYPKDIQCEAIKELALRTEQGPDKNC